MMIKKTWIPYLIFLLSLTGMYSCEYDVHEQCQDVELGTINFEKTDESIFPYHEHKVWVFKDSLGHQVKFATLKWEKISSNWYPAMRTLKEGDCAGQAHFNAFLPYIHITYHSDSLQLTVDVEYRVNLDVVDDVPLFYDFLFYSIEGRSDPDHHWRYFTTEIINARGNEDYLAPRYEPLVFEENTILGGKTFENVLESTNAMGSQLYFNHKDGLVAFKSPAGPQWVFDHFE
jgi:hypothetical protein